HTFGKLGQLYDYTSNLNELEDAARYFDRHNLPEYVDRINSAIQKLRSDKEILDREREQQVPRSQQAALIRRIPVRGPVSELKRALEDLSKIKLFPENVVLANQQKEFINKEIARLNGFASSL